ncbi:poly(U)-specific 3'-to-5' RNA exonuclease [Pleurotus pulmonarius]|nr:poly(U)-specific 3'-to-5' RNA exonuclease [Pleurotus pulmonarius]KAF4591214.1 poly(U)-specific 3'-to-5' RNA exonuclease [Pleurotus pulmonarius]
MKRASLVTYSSSDDEPAPVAKKRKLPALASSLVPSVPVDNPALHQGRVRTQPHVDGQFAAFVYVLVGLDKGSPLRQLLSDAFRTAKATVECLQELKDLPLSEDGKLSDGAKPALHISLSRPVYLRAYQRDEFKRAVKQLATKFSPFDASFATFSELTNDEKTRTFLAIEIGGGHNELKGLSEGLTPILTPLRQKAYYAEARFHASFAWALLQSMQQVKPPGNGVDTEFPSADFHAIPEFPTDLVPELNKAYKSRLSSTSISTFTVENIHVKIGREESTWRLRQI